MKKLIGIIAFAVVLILGSYYAMGPMMERAVNENIQVINANNNGIKVTLDGYERHWFFSKANLNWQIQIPEQVEMNDAGQTNMIPAKSYQMPMSIEILHGPIMMVNQGLKFGIGYAFTNLSVPQQYMEQFKETFTEQSTPPAITLSLFVNYLNKSDLQFSIPEFKLIAKKNGAEFDWKGMSSRMSVSSNMKNFEGHFSVNGINFSQDQTQSVLGPITSEYHLTKSDEGLFVGGAQISLPSIVISQNQQKRFELDALDIHSSSEISAGLFNSSLHLSLDKIYANETTYGPGSLKIAIRNLDAKVLGHINQEANKLQQGTEELRQQVLFGLLAELPKLLAQGAAFSVDELKFTVPDGVIDGQLLVNLPKGDLNNPFELVQKIKGQGKLVLPQSVMDSVLLTSAKQKLAQQPASDALASAMITASGGESPTTQATETSATTTTSSTPTQSPEDLAKTMLANMLASGLVVKQNNQYVLSFEYGDSQLTINGKPYAPAMMNF